MTTPARKIRCRVLTKVTLDRCQSEALSDLGFCAHHLAAAAEEFRKLTGQAEADLTIPAWVSGRPGGDGQ